MLHWSVHCKAYIDHFSAICYSDLYSVFLREYVKAKQGETPAYTNKINKILKQEIKRGENWDFGYNIDFLWMGIY